jgi:NitT/TauT family transport system substrate-binding protein
MRWIVALLLSITSLASAAEKTTIALNWVPEPEFGGIYAAKEQGFFAKNQLDVDIKPGGAGVPTWQRVARGQVDFAVSSADEVVIARSQGADVVAIFTIYQTCPQAIMVHKSRGLKDLAEVFKSGTLALEIGLPYGKFLKEKYGINGAKQIPYTGGIANFLADKNFAQQCFIFAEPIMAKAKGADPQTFLIADSGYNPYTGVIITSGKLAKEKPGLVAMMIQSMEQGWRAYLDDPKPANDVMSQLNKQMDPETFAAGAEAQKPLIEGDKDRGERLGRMKLERWQTLIDQLAAMKLLKESPEAKSCFLTEDALLPGTGRK